jgi:nitrite reductase/ring-hydroxylating ferredoxin subunit
MEAPPGSSKKPLWTEEFSVHAADDRYVLRRQFTKFLTLTSFGMLVGNGWIYVKSLLDARTRGAALPRAVIASSAEVPVGGVKLFRYPTPQDPCILVRSAGAQLVAYSQKCTHLSCAVVYSSENHRLECPCHQGYFSIQTGRVLQGPPPRPLPRIVIEERDGQIFATGIQIQEEGA